MDKIVMDLMEEGAERLGLNTSSVSPGNLLHMNRRKLQQDFTKLKEQVESVESDNGDNPTSHHDAKHYMVYMENVFYASTSHAELVTMLEPLQTLIERQNSIQLLHLIGQAIFEILSDGIKNAKKIYLLKFYNALVRSGHDTKRVDTSKIFSLQEMDLFKLLDHSLVCKDIQLQTEQLMLLHQLLPEIDQHMAHNFFPDQPKLQEALVIFRKSLFTDGVHAFRECLQVKDIIFSMETVLVKIGSEQISVLGNDGEAESMRIFVDFNCTNRTVSFRQCMTHSQTTFAIIEYNNIKDIVIKEFVHMTVVEIAIKLTRSVSFASSKGKIARFRCSKHCLHELSKYDDPFIKLFLSGLKGFDNVGKATTFLHDARNPFDKETLISHPTANILRSPTLPDILSEDLDITGIFNESSFTFKNEQILSRTKSEYHDSSFSVNDDLNFESFEIDLSLTGISTPERKPSVLPNSQPDILENSLKVETGIRDSSEYYTPLLIETNTDQFQPNSNSMEFSTVPASMPKHIDKVLIARSDSNTRGRKAERETKLKPKSKKTKLSTIKRKIRKNDGPTAATKGVVPKPVDETLQIGITCVNNEPYVPKQVEELSESKFCVLSDITVKKTNALYTPRERDYNSDDSIFLKDTQKTSTLRENSKRLVEDVDFEGPMLKNTKESKSEPKNKKTKGATKTNKITNNNQDTKKQMFNVLPIEASKVNNAPAVGNESANNKEPNLLTTLSSIDVLAKDTKKKECTTTKESLNTNQQFQQNSMTNERNVDQKEKSVSKKNKLLTIKPKIRKNNAQREATKSVETEPIVTCVSNESNINQVEQLTKATKTLAIESKLTKLDSESVTGVGKENVVLGTTNLANSETLANESTIPTIIDAPIHEVITNPTLAKRKSKETNSIEGKQESDAFKRKKQEFDDLARKTKTSTSIEEQKVDNYVDCISDNALQIGLTFDKNEPNVANQVEETAKGKSSVLSNITVTRKTSTLRENKRLVEDVDFEGHMWKNTKESKSEPKKKKTKGATKTNKTTKVNQDTEKQKFNALLEFSKENNAPGVENEIGNNKDLNLLTTLSSIDVAEKETKKKECTTTDESPNTNQQFEQNSKIIERNAEQKEKPKFKKSKLLTLKPTITKNEAPSEATKSIEIEQIVTTCVSNESNLNQVDVLGEATITKNLDIESKLTKVYTEPVSQISKENLVLEKTNHANSKPRANESTIPTNIVDVPIDEVITNPTTAKRKLNETNSIEGKRKKQEFDDLIRKTKTSTSIEERKVDNFVDCIIDNAYYLKYNCQQCVHQNTATDTSVITSPSACNISAKRGPCANFDSGIQIDKEIMESKSPELFNTNDFNEFTYNKISARGNPPSTSKTDFGTIDKTEEGARKYSLSQDKMRDARSFIKQMQKIHKRQKAKRAKKRGILNIDRKGFRALPTEFQEDFKKSLSDMQQIVSGLKTKLRVLQINHHLNN